MPYPKSKLPSQKMEVKRDPGQASRPLAIYA